MIGGKFERDGDKLIQPLWWRELGQSATLEKLSSKNEQRLGPRVTLDTLPSEIIDLIVEQIMPDNKGPRFWLKGLVGASKQFHQVFRPKFLDIQYIGLCNVPECMDRPYHLALFAPVTRTILSNLDSCIRRLEVGECRKLIPKEHRLEALAGHPYPQFAPIREGVMVEGVQVWDDFTFTNVMKCFGDILSEEFSSDILHQPAPIYPHHLRLIDESSVDKILTKHNHTIVECTLQVAQSRLEDRGFHVPISWSWGSLSHVEEDPRLRPDWAGTEYSGTLPYLDRVPGDTKQSRKWSSAMQNSKNHNVQEEFRKPLRQVLRYANRVNTRYFFLISDAEVVCIRRRRSPDPPQPLSTNRPRRHVVQADHRRVTSVTTIVSGTSAMSLDSSGSPCTDAGNPDMNEAPLELCVVPWSNYGFGKLTVNLAMFAGLVWAAQDTSVQERYPSLGS